MTVAALFDIFFKKFRSNTDTMLIIKRTSTLVY
jgi:hypothetical protein